jgi:hypothetical protein
MSCSVAHSRVRRTVVSLAALVAICGGGDI